jgi:hypothetical protein
MYLDQGVSFLPQGQLAARDLGTYSIHTEQSGSTLSAVHFAVNMIRSFGDNDVIFGVNIILKNTCTF